MFSCMPFSRQIDFLDKRQCNLSQIPDEILRYTRSLEELLLDSNHIRELSKPLFRFHKLKRLALSDNEIAKLPPDISQLANLIELDLSKNDISDIPENIKNCKHLQHLDISNNMIISFPPCLLQLNALTHLGLSDISLAELPADIGQLVNLHILELRDNAINVLPPSFVFLTKLKVLDLGTNEFEKLPPEIGKLTGLEELYIDGNSLEYLSKDIANLHQLISFDVAENKLLALPEEIGELKNLSDLTLSQNCLETLPNSIGKLKKLNILKLDKNRLINLTPAIGSCIGLTELILTENLLTEIPSSIGNLKDLAVLNVDKNRIKELPYTIGCCANLAVLSLRDNLLGALVDEIGKLDKLSVLDVSGNWLQFLPYTLNALQHLQALWLCDNQSQPMLKLQTDFDQRTGIKVLTCYLLPQQDYRSPDSARPISSSNGPAAAGGGASFAGGPKVHFPDVDQDSGDDQEESAIGKFERHDTPHPKHGPKPKGRQIDGHVVHHGDSQVENRPDNFTPSFKRICDNENDCTKQDDGYHSTPTNLSNPELNTQNDKLERPLPSPASRSVNFMPDFVPHGRPRSAQHEEDHFDHETNRLLRKNTPHPAKATSISPDALAMQEKVVEILARQQKIAQKTTKIDDFPTNNWQTEKTMQKLNIVVHRDEKGLGLSIAGGLGSSPYLDDDPSIFVSKVVEQGAAYRAGLRVGDKLVAVDDVEVSLYGHNDCVDLMKAAASGERRALNLVVLRQRQPPATTAVLSVDRSPSLPCDTVAATIRREPSTGGGFGFSIAGGKGSPMGDFVHISKITASGATERDGKLKIGDRVVSINSVNVCESRHDHAVALLTGAGSEVHLIVQRDHQPSRQCPINATLSSQIRPVGPTAVQWGEVPPLAQSSPVAANAPMGGLTEEITLMKRGGPLGLTIVGGLDHSSHPFGMTEPGIFVSKIVPNGSAAKTGKLRIGDRLLSVNGRDVSKATHKEAVSALMSVNNEILLVIRHDPQPPGLKEFTIARVGDEQLGIDLCGGVSTPANAADSSDDGIFISSITDNSAVRRDGRLKVGDRLLEVNNKSILGATKSDVLESLRSAGGPLQLLICDGPAPANLVNTTSTHNGSIAHVASKVASEEPKSATTANELSFDSGTINQNLPSKKFIGIPVPKPYVSKTPTSPKLFGWKSTDPIPDIQNQTIKNQPMVQNIARSVVELEPTGNTQPSSSGTPTNKSHLPIVPPKPSLLLDFTALSASRPYDSTTNDNPSADVLARSKIPCAKPSNIPVSSEAATPSTPSSGDSHPEKLPFTRKLKKFEQEIEQRAPDGEKSKLVPPKKIALLPNVSSSNQCLSDEAKKIAVVGCLPRSQSSKQNFENDDSNLFVGSIPASTSNSSIPAVVRTKTAENRLLKKSGQWESDQNSDLDSSQMSPAESRAIEAAKRAEWRKARLKSLELDALKAEKVMSRVRDISDSINPDEEPEHTNNGQFTNASDISSSLNEKSNDVCHEIDLIDVSQIGIDRTEGCFTPDGLSAVASEADIVDDGTDSHTDDKQ